MLRTLLLFIVLLIVIVIALVALGVVNLRQDGNGVSIQTSDVEVGTTVRNVQIPVVRMENRQVEVPSVGVENEAQPANAQ
ncbi:MAG TPA: hypothetical protein VN231_04815 [Allosphingosinicella sp.]|nr:hypothetical protein [Allosphingosinicella sp.]